MKYFLVLLLFASSVHAECNPPRDKYGHIARSKKVLSDFRKTIPCPATGKTGKRCAGYVIDHIKPLCACGPDSIENLQWQTIADAKAKDRRERKMCGSAD
jgi:hypothetical protein